MYSQIVTHLFQRRPIRFQGSYRFQHSFASLQKRALLKTESFFYSFQKCGVCVCVGGGGGVHGRKHKEATILSGLKSRMGKTGSLSPIQSAQQVHNMFSYKSVNGTNNARPTDSKKNGNFQNNDFYPKMKFCQNTGKILCLMKTILCHTQKNMQTQPFFE